MNTEPKNLTPEFEQEINDILSKVFPKEVIYSLHRGKFSIGNTEYLRMSFRLSDETINRVNGQYPQRINLCIWDDFTCNTQPWGGMGGQSVYRKPNMDDPKEKYLAMKGVKVPFRQPKKEAKFVLRAVKRYAENYLKVLKENKDNLKYQNLVDYSFLDDVVTVSRKK
jgi:hypothetical protein